MVFKKWLSGHFLDWGDKEMYKRWEIQESYGRERIQKKKIYFERGLREKEM